MSTYKKAKYEPKWYDAVNCIDAASRLKVQNLVTVSAALGSVGSPSEDLGHVRNFFAHRGKNTIDSIHNKSSLTHLSHYDLETLVGEMVPPGVTRMDPWVDGLRLIAEAATQ